MPKSDPYALLYIASSRLPGFYEPKVSESDAYAPAAMPAERNNNTAKRYGFAVLIYNVWFAYFSDAVFFLRQTDTATAATSASNITTNAA